MRFQLSLGAAAAGLLATAPTASVAQQPKLAIQPSRPSMGALVRVDLDKVVEAGDSVLAITGTMAGEPLHFRQTISGSYRALAAIPIDASDSVVANVQIERESGTTDSARVFLKYPHRAPAATVAAVSKKRIKAPAARRLKVDPKFTRADPDADARVAHENELARDVGRKAQDTPQLWSLPFLRPRPSKVTSKFGTGRVFNGRVLSAHLGIDYRGQTGEPIFAANRGVVALVAEFYLAGNVVYIDHGDGVVTGYFHMSKPEVAVGDTVERGQEIGLVGATGRVTGPHLHWSARFGSLTIDPADLFGLEPPFVSIPIRKDGN